MTFERSAELTLPGDAVCGFDFLESADCGSTFARDGLELGPHVLVVFSGESLELTDRRYRVVDRPVSMG